MPRPSLGYRELSRVFPPWSEQSTASRQRPAHQGHRGASWSPELLAAGTVPTLGRLWDTAVDTISQSARAPRHAGMSPQGQGPEEPPPPPSSCLLHSSLLTSSLPLPRERPLLPSEFPQPPLSACPPETVSPRHWHRPHPSCQGRLLPGEPADPHVFTQARGAGLTQT